MKTQTNIITYKIFDNNWNLDEVVFQNRNKKFGAYTLRKNYSKVLISIVFFQMVLFLSLYLVFILNPKSKNTDFLIEQNIGQVTTPEMSVITVDIQESPKPTEIKKHKTPQIGEGPTPIPSENQNESNSDITETSNTEFEPPPVADDEIQPPLDEENQKELANNPQENIDFFEKTISDKKIENTQNIVSNKNLIVLKTKEEKENFEKIKKRVKKVYPYVVLAEIKLKELETKVSLISEKKDKKELTRKFEEELRNEFSEEISKLNMEEGKILMKLLNRNTGQSAYEILKNFRGRLIAGLAQNVAKFFGQDLKSQFNKTEDAMIETAVIMVEKGMY
jgi:hypothetical protein